LLSCESSVATRGLIEARVRLGLIFRLHTLAERGRTPELIIDESILLGLPTKLRENTAAATATAYLIRTRRLLLIEELTGGFRRRPRALLFFFPWWRL